jgi:hypothetical protein
MKINLKVLIAIAVIVVVAVWAFSSVLPHSFNGSNLTFSVGTGMVTVNNPSDAPAAVQLVGKGARAFNVLSTMGSIAGSSTKQGTGGATSQLYEYASPPGISDFSVVRGSDVSFVSQSDTRLEATVQPLTADETRTTLIVAAVVILSSLFYISRSNDHRLIKALFRREVPVPVVVAGPLVTTPVGDPNRGRDGRMYSNYGTKD